MDTPVPHVSPELIHWLDKTYPNVLPTDTTVSLDELRLLQGEQRIVRKLKGIYADQLEQQLLGSPE